MEKEKNIKIKMNYCIAECDNNLNETTILSFFRKREDAEHSYKKIIESKQWSINDDFTIKIIRLEDGFIVSKEIFKLK